MTRLDAGRLLAIGKAFHYPLRLITSTEQIRSHLVVTGNAAPPTTPVAGQGFNLSIRVHTASQNTESTALGSLKQLKDYEQERQTDQLNTTNIYIEPSNYSHNQTGKISIFANSG